MTIYTLTKTQLNHDTEIWHFPTKEQAQKKMIEICNNIVGQPICGLNTKTMTDCWAFESGFDCATLDCGDKIEFDIHTTGIDLKAFLTAAITERVMHHYEDTVPYREMLFDIVQKYVDGLDEECLPQITDSQIDDFIDSHLLDDMEKQARDIVCKDYKDNDKVLRYCSTYLKGHCDTNLIVRVLNNELAAIDEVQIGVNDLYGEKIFNDDDFVLVAESFITGGAHYFPEFETEVFGNLKSAQLFMEETMIEMRSNFSGNYDSDDIVTEKSDNGLEYRVNAYDDGCVDCWIGTISRKRINN